MIKTLHTFESLAEQLGYTSYFALLEDLYVQKQYTMAEVAFVCHTSWPRVQEHLRHFNIRIRRPGQGRGSGPIVIVTDDLLREVMRSGISATARRCGVSTGSLRYRLSQVDSRRVMQVERELLRQHAGNRP